MESARFECEEDVLSNLAPGVCCLVKRVCDLCPHARELHRLGLVEGEEVKVLSKGSCLMLQCGGSRVALDRRLAEKVEVWLIEGTGPSGPEVPALP